MVNKVILIAGFTQRQRDDISTWLHDVDYLPLMAHDIKEALRIIVTTKLDLIIVDAQTRAQIPETHIRVFVTSDPTQHDLLSQVRSLLKS
jgi:hypothetical protein